MARRANNATDNTIPPAGPAVLRIQEWDEGEASAGWFGVTITYRPRSQPTVYPEAARLDLDLPRGGGFSHDESDF